MNRTPHNEDHQQYNYQSRGLLYSVAGHVIILLSFLIGNIFGGSDLGPETIYSITLEGGAQLGGISQAPNKNNKEKPAPPKPVASKEEEKKEEPVKTEPVKEEKKAEPKIEEKEAEVSTKVEPVVSPKPEPKKEEKKEEPKKEEPKKPEPPKKKEEEKPKKDPNKEKLELEKEYLKAMQRYQGESTDAGGQGFGAGRVGGQGMGGGEQRPPEFFTYRDLIKRTVKKNWNWFDTATSLRATITFTISKTGELSDVSIAKSSGNSLFDNSVVRAVLKSSPLEPPPDNVYQFFKIVRTEFDPQD